MGKQIENSLVSVIIPTYKRSEMLVRAIDSVLNQTYANVQVIVVDDNNPDTEWRINTTNRMKKYEGDARVKYILHDKNRNGSAARNTGFLNSEGIYICFLDDDDYFHSNKIEVQVKYLQSHQDYDACFCDFEKSGTSVIIDYKEDYSSNILLGISTPQTSGIIFRRNVIEYLNGFDESYFRHQDYEILLRFYDYFKMGKVEQVLYVRDKSSIDNTPNGKKVEETKKKLLLQFNYKLTKLLSKDKKLKKKVIVYNCVDLFKCYAKDGNYVDALRVLNKSLLASSANTLRLLFSGYKAHKQHKN